MLHYNPRHVSSINMPIFRRTNCIITGSGIVTLCKRLYSMPDESRLQSILTRYLIEVWQWCSRFIQLPQRCKLSSASPRVNQIPWTFGDVTGSPDTTVTINHRYVTYQKNEDVNVAILLQFWLLTLLNCWNVLDCCKNSFFGRTLNVTQHIGIMSLRSLTQ